MTREDLLGCAWWPWNMAKAIGWSAWIIGRAIFGPEDDE